jgi:BirA family transcriptional regulator, biotin operon repressor / biotin---[acetyl-CoA-carboxylase] ligase
MSDLLDADLIHRSLSDQARTALDSLDVLDVVPSTNTWLMQQEHREPGRFRAVLAEYQTAGRGRQSKRWVSPPRASVCLSIAYTFSQSPKNLSCLTLAAGVGVLAALRGLGIDSPQLKWPNDLYAGGAKLGGILTDAQSGAGGLITTICGVGLNVDLGAVTDPADLASIDYTITDLQSHIDKALNRSVIAAALIEQLIRVISRFEQEGLDPFRADWNNADWLRGKTVKVTMPDSEITGTADGIDANGALRVLTEHGRRRVYTGSIEVLDRKGSAA